MSLGHGSDRHVQLSDQPESPDTPAPAPQSIRSIPGIEELWAQTLGDPEICIAVLDGPVDQSHACFAGADLTVLAAGDSPRADGGPASQHGTHVASTIFGQQGSPVEGVAPRCRGLIVPVFQDGRDRTVRPSTQVDLAAAITRAIENGAHIVNISGGELIRTGSVHPILSDVVRKVSEQPACRNRCALIVAAAGNQGCDCEHRPGAIPSVLAVGAMNRQGEPLDFSNFGSAYQQQGILAPGEEIAGAAVGGGIVPRTGTSFASPIVAGVSALLLSIQKQTGQAVDPMRVRQALLSSATPCDSGSDGDCRRILAGRLDVSEAHRALLAEDDGSGVGQSACESQTHGPGSICGREMNRRETPVSEETAEGIEQSSIRDAEIESPGETTATETASNADAFTSDSNSTEAQTRRKGCMMDDQRVQHQTPEESSVTVEPVSQAPVDVSPVPESAGVEASAASVAAPVPVAQPVVAPQEAAVPPSSICVPDPSPQIQPVPAFEVPALLPSGVDPSACACGGGKAQPPQLVYVLGTLDYDLQSEARRDAFVGTLASDNRNPGAAADLVSHLSADGNEHEAADITWILKQESTPIYAIQPAGPFAQSAYAQLVKVLGDQESGAVERLAIAGYVSSQKVTLLSGQQVSLVVPDLRGSAAWKTSDLCGSDDDDPGVREFLHRVYYDLRNLGVAGSDRALNFAATNAFQVFHIFSDAIQKNLQLDSVDTEPSPVCRPDSECYDVKLTFFDPENTNRAGSVYRFTVDVSDVVPVLIDEVRSFTSRLR